MKARVVIGANFGDEGKGLAVDWLCSQSADWVVRFNGGANAGHTVTTPEGDRHVFRHFGSGTLLGVPTYLSQFFVCNPILFFEELKQLSRLGIDPVVAAHPDCLITTHVDMLINQEREKKRGEKRHGSCGVGLHETMQRSRVDGLKITLGDLWHGSGIRDRLREIGERWSSFRVGKSFAKDEVVEMFAECAISFAERVHPMGMGQIKDPVFEGSQGLLLSQDNAEYAPHLTHSYTGSRNARVLCAQAKIDPEFYYISRTYLTRHGAGHLPGEDPSLRYQDNTNGENPWQGTLRFAPLDHGLRERIARDAGSSPYKLVLTHCDQLPGDGADFYSHGPTREAILRKQAFV
jgi:adenylosuccinate synthase